MGEIADDIADQAMMAGVHNRRPRINQQPKETPMAKRAAAAKPQKENIIPEATKEPEKLPVPTGSAAGATGDTPGFAVHRQNLELWDRIFATDPAHTKGFKRGGGFAGTAIKPFWLMKRATEEFGPVGIGWGWEVVQEQQVAIETGQRMWFSSVRVWYLRQHRGVTEKRYVGPQWGGTELVAKRKDGSLFFDEEAPKKSVTDGITKCLSYLGFGGDVHMGLFDDSKYVADTNEAFREKEDAAAEAHEVAKADGICAKWRDGVVEAIKLAENREQLEVVWAGHVGTYKKYSKSDLAPEKAAANYVLSQFKRKGAELDEANGKAAKDQQDAGENDAQLEDTAAAGARTAPKPTADTRQAAE